MVKNCSLLKCVSGSPNDRKIRKSNNLKQASLFRVPKDATLLAQWSSVLNMNLCRKEFICEFHFKEEDIVKEVRHDFPDGSFQIIPRERWSLLPTAIPINSEPRKYDNDNEFSTVEENEPFQQLDNRPSIERIPSVLSESPDSEDEESIDDPLNQQSYIHVNNEETNMDAEQCNTMNSDEVIYLYSTVEENEPFQELDNQPSIERIPSVSSENADSEDLDAFLHEASIDDPLINQQSYSNVKNRETNMDAEQCNTMNSDKRSMTFKDIESFINVPPAWYYIFQNNEMIFVHVDSFKFSEKLRMFINEDMSVMVSYNQQKKIDLNLKITCPADLSKLFKELKQTSICSGTGFEDMSASARCCGFISNSESYKRQQVNPRCTACRILRRQLLTKISKQRHAANGNQEPLRSFKNKCKRLQKKVNLLQNFLSVVETSERFN